MKAYGITIQTLKLIWSFPGDEFEDFRVTQQNSLASGKLSHRPLLVIVPGKVGFKAGTGPYPKVCSELLLNKHTLKGYT